MVRVVSVPPFAILERGFYKSTASVFVGCAVLFLAGKITLAVRAGTLGTGPTIEMSPRALAAPLHRHNREDEYSYVLEGRMGALLGEEVLEAGPGDLVFKPRNQWHTFWNAGDEPARLLELISPPGFENYFREMGELVADGPPDPERRAAIAAKYELEVDPESVASLVEGHGLRFGGAE